MAIRHAGDRIAPSWRFALSLLGGVRRWVFLPSLVMAVPALVLLRGGDALSVCLNTVAVLFLCEIDNLAYAVFLPEKLHARVEDEGRVELGEVEAAALMRSKTAHVVALVLVVPCAVMAGGIGKNAGFEAGMYLPRLAFWVAGVAEAVLGSAGADERCKEVGRVTGRWMLGVVGFLLLMVSAGI